MRTPVAPVCCDPLRADAVRASAYNGIDYLDVGRDPRVLDVYLFHPAPERIIPANVQITGGVRVRGLKVLDLRIGRAGGAVGDADLQVVLDRPGDLSTYCMRLVELDDDGVPTDRPMAEFDPLYTAISFRFRDGGATEQDCKPVPVSAPSSGAAPDINYLAKDYASFRQLILDRLAVTMPAWTETHVPDIGIALLEILAYVGDYLSYYQDAVGTEAYLATARQRVSVRRHLRLLDYRMHDGCNARAWLVLLAGDPAARLTLDADTLMFASVDDGVPAAALATVAGGGVPRAMQEQLDVFEPVAAVPLRVLGAHDAISFYGWGNARCTLRAGATRATLRDRWGPAAAPHRALQLRVGDFLCFEQVKGVHSGDPLDADPTLRHVVRLRRVDEAVDVLFDPAVPIVEIEWEPEDALPFPLQLSAVGDDPACTLIEDIWVARGNVALIDEGVRVVDEPLGSADPQAASVICAGPGMAQDAPVRAAMFQPVLRQPGLISVQMPAAGAPAAGLLDQQPDHALPWIRLRSIPGTPDGAAGLFAFGELAQPEALLARLADPMDPTTWYLRAQLSTETRAQLAGYQPAKPLPAPLRAQILAELHGLVRHWTPVAHLLASRADHRHFVVELDDDGFATLRFGDGVLGRAPEAGESFSASYRIALDTIGHTGAESITRVLVRPDGLLPDGLRVRNPFAAHGRVAPQSIMEARTLGPGTPARRRERAITADDYAALALANPRVQRAAATLLWTGNRYEARVAIDPLGTEDAAPRLLRAIHADLEARRCIGHDVVVVPARYVPLDLHLTAQLLPGHSRAHTERGLVDALSDRVLPDGTLGFFHPDRLTFGQGIQVSLLQARAQAVPGIASVRVVQLARLFGDPDQSIQNGMLAIAPLEIARLDNVPGQPELGRLVVELKGAP
jgi:hypothetical protein